MKNHRKNLTFKNCIILDVNYLIFIIEDKLPLR